jgi:ParB/RepB/Spo0J family partition protein
MPKPQVQTAVEPPQVPADPPQPQAQPPATPTRSLLPIAAIDPNPWNRRPFSKRPDPEDQALTANIAQHGVLQNLLVRPMPGGRYQLIFGERRLRCAKAAHLTEVPAIVRDIDDHQARVLTVSENLHRKGLHFLDEAAGVAELIDEHWSVQTIAAKLGKPLSWVARRRRLLNLTPSWQDLARAGEDWTASWGAAHFEQIALLEAPAQDELLGRDRWQLERCTSVHQLAQRIGSHTLALASFAWKLDDAELDPVAGACSLCPHRSSRHPGLFDDQEATADLPSPGRGKPRKTAPAEPPDRCLNPQCAARKGKLYVERKKVELAGRYGSVLLLQEGHSAEPIPGAIRDYEIEPAKKDSDGAVRALIANGPHLGDLRWVKPRKDLSRRAQPRVAGEAPQKKPLAERQAQRWRQRKVHAIGLLKAALLDQPSPPLLISVRLAIVFGTAQTHSSSSHAYDTALPRIAPGLDLAEERRRMLGHGASATLTDAAFDRPFHPSAAVASVPPDADPAPHPDPDPDQDQAQDSRESLLWRTFDALASHDAACAEYLSARTLRVMLDRMTPNGDWRHVDVAWHEAERIAPLFGLDAQTCLDQARQALPDPKSWAKELAPAPTPKLPAAPEPAPDQPQPPVKLLGCLPRGQRAPRPATVTTPRHRVASRLPR